MTFIIYNQTSEVGMLHLSSRISNPALLPSKQLVYGRITESFWNLPHEIHANSATSVEESATDLQGSQDKRRNTQSLTVVNWATLKRTSVGSKVFPEDDTERTPTNH